MPFSKEDIGVLANKVHSVITISFEAACPMRKSRREKGTIWCNSELASLRKEARQAWRKTVKTRGGVEDTRLEAKAKDTKKIRGQGQGQPFRGQTLSRPRTGMLGTKAKDQGHKRKCSPKKKKGLHKNFSSDLHKKTFSKNFFKRFTKF